MQRYWRLSDLAVRFLELVRRWTTQEEYSHGFLIPLVAVWLLWSRRDALLASVSRPAWSGVILILLAMVMHAQVLSAIFILFPAGFRCSSLLGTILAIGGFLSCSEPHLSPSYF